MNFDGTRAKYWGDRLKGIKRKPLNAETCVLEIPDQETLHDILFDGDGMLHQSTRLEALVITYPLKWADVVAIFEQAPTAWPNLKLLSLDNQIDRYAPDAEDLDVHALLSQLEVATWKPTRAGYLRAESNEYGTLEYRLLSAKHKVSDYVAAVTPYLEGFESNRWHPAISVRLAKRIVYCTRSKATMRALGRLVGLKSTPRDERDALAPRVFEMLAHMIAPEGVRPSPYAKDMDDFDALKPKMSGIFHQNSSLW